MRLIGQGPVVAALVAAAACAPAPPPSEPNLRPARCDAEAVGRELIGSHVGAVDFAPGANVRIACTTCAVTEDHRPDRLNIRFDQATGVIRSVTCG